MKVDAGIALKRWPYGLELRASPQGVFIGPRAKVRAGWSKAFKTKIRRDDLQATRQVVNSFDHQEWKW